jgi:hypothetical protein
MVEKTLRLVMTMPFRPLRCVIEFVQRNIDRCVLPDITGMLPHGRHAPCATLPVSIPSLRSLVIKPDNSSAT